MRKKILKVGEKVYSQSLQHFDSSYLVGFPQREQQLLKHLTNIDFDFFNHKLLTDISVITEERGRLSSYVAGKKIDYLFIDNPFSVLVIDPQLHIPIVFDCIDWYEEMYFKEYGVDRRFFLLRYGLADILERTNKVVAQSPVILESLKTWGLKSDRCEVVPNGYDAKIFYPYSNSKKARLRRTIEKRHNCHLVGKKVVVYTGKLGYWYDNIKLIAQAIPQDYVFLIVGDGPLNKEIPALDNVVKCGAVRLEEVPNYSNIADVLVFPVDVDCSPIAISEYLAVGKPIVIGKGRMEWLLKDGVTGCLVDNNINSWRLSIKKASEMGEICMLNNIRLARDISWQKLAIKFSRFINK